MSASPAFTVKRHLVRSGGFTYYTFRVVGWLNGQRVRKQFADQAQALGEKQRLEILAANSDHLRSVPTRLRPAQVAEAEAAVRRLGGVSLTAAVDWYLANYRPPVIEKPLADAIAAFLAEKRVYVSPRVAREYKRELARLQRAFPGAAVHGLDTEQITEYMRRWNLGKKGWNNLRGYLHTFFEWCACRPRSWAAQNPVRGIPVHKVARGIPEILTAARVGELFAFLETYSGPPRGKQPAGFLVPYFALATFAGLRPAVPGGEIWKLGHLATLDRVLDLANGVIRIGPGVAKTNDLRQVTIQPNLREWLARYPLRQFPLVMRNMQAAVTSVRVKFGLTHDVLRHTFISMHVAKFRSLGDAALQAGNSEWIIKRHYLNLATTDEADRFWSVGPASRQ